MSVVAVKWRPIGSHDLDEARTQVDSALAAWQTEWFDTPAIQVQCESLIASHTGFAFPDGTRVHQVGSSLWWSMPASASARLTNLALDLPEDYSIAAANARSAPLLELDRQMMDGLRAALTSVCGRQRDTELDTLSGAEADRSLPLPRGGLHLRVLSRSGVEIVSIVISADLLLMWTPPRMAGERRSDAPPASLTPRSSALAPVRLRLSARLGQAELTVRQLHGLEVGDVIALDRPLDGAIDLVVDQPGQRAHHHIRTGNLGRVGHSLSIQLNTNNNKNVL
ncbi:FliM/FliN family flagellar motor switch protein [Paraburkholderia terrae]|uniref:FliM/FliN family flagellar motor switch protein n=1 Tax=Paraburkholderia terrae TaxID=311230 RepID=UPI0033654CA1